MSHILHPINMGIYAANSFKKISKGMCLKWTLSGLELGLEDPPKKSKTISLDWKLIVLPILLGLQDQVLHDP